MKKSKYVESFLDDDTETIGGKEYKKIGGNYVPYNKKEIGKYKGMKTNVSSEERKALSSSVSQDDIDYAKINEEYQFKRQDDIDENYHTEKNPKYDNSPKGTERKYFIVPNELRAENKNQNGRGIASSETYNEALRNIDNENKKTQESFNKKDYESRRFFDKQPDQYNFGAEDDRGNQIEAGRNPSSEPNNYVMQRPINVFGPNDETSLSQFSALQEMKKNSAVNPINSDTINKTVSDVVEPNKATTDYIKNKEGFTSVPHKDVAGNLTVGYGKNIQNMTPEQTQELYKGGVGKELDDRVSDASNFVEDYSQMPLTPKQKTAFVSLYDNAGPAIAKKAIDIFQTQGVEASQDYFRKIINSGGKPVQGLMNRRNEEAAMLSSEQLPSSQQNQNQTLWSQQQNLARTNESIGQGEAYAFGGHQEIQPEARSTMDVMDKRMGQVQQGIGGAQMPKSWDSAGLGMNQNVAPMQQNKNEAGALLPVTKKVTPHQDVANAQVQKAEEIASKLPAQKDEVQDALNKLKASTMAAADAAEKGLHDIALEQAKLADDQFNRLNHLAGIQDDASRKYQKTLEEIDTDVNKNRMWDNMPIANKLIAALSLFAGAFTRDGQNRALTIFQAEIEKDLKNQKLEYERKGEKAKNAYSIAVKHSNDEIARMQLARSIQAGLIEAKLSELKASMIRPEAQKAIDQMQYNMEVAKKEAISKAFEKQIELQMKLMGAEYQKQRADYYKGMTEKNFAERSSRWDNSAVVRTKSLATSFDAIAPRRMEVIEMMDDLANQVQALSALKVSNPYYKREREVIKATVSQLAGRFAGIINDKTGGIVVKEADLAEDALLRLTGVDSILNSVTTPNGAIQRANDLRKISERVKDSARRSFDSAYMKQDGSTFSDEEKDSMLGFTKKSGTIEEW